MAVTAAQLLVKINADTEGLKRGLKQAGDEANKSGGFFQNALSSLTGFVAGGAILGAVSTAFGFLKDQASAVWQATNDADQALVQLTSTLTSTHDASGMTIKGLTGIADGLSQVTDYSKPTIEQSEKVLLTFTDIGKKVFPQAEQATVDLAARMGLDLSQAALIVGKALGDPIKGVGSLRREGVQLSAQQADLVKKLVGTGDVAGAQAVILKELEREMGGAAKAAGETFGGQLDIARNKLDEMRAQIGHALEPELAKLLTGLQPVISAIGAALPVALNVAGTFITTQVIPVVRTLYDWFSKNVLPIVLQLAHIFVTDVLPALQSIWASLEKSLIPALGKLWAAIAPQLIPVLQLIGSILKNIVGPAIAGVIDLVGFLVDKLADLINFLKPVTDLIGKLDSGIANGLNGLGSALHGLHIPGFAEGGVMPSSGLAVVGESGPELVALPGGARVYPSGMGPSGGGTQIIRIELDSRVIAQAALKGMPEHVRLATGMRI